ncbi:peptidylprolyl isomerase [Limibacillus halophilus]
MRPIFCPAGPRKLRHTILAAVFLALFSLYSGGVAHAQNSLSAAAVVNDDIITGLDLNQRTRLAILSIGAQDTPEIRQRLTPQVLRVMIDERLQLQEAERLSLEITEQEIDQAFDTIAQRNNLTSQQFTQALSANGVLPATMRAQIRAELAWRKVIDRRMRSQVAVSDEQVQAEEERLRAAEGEEQYRIGELFLAVDDPSQETQVLETAQRLLQELRRGVQFQSLARQFSESMTAPVGGDMGFITIDQLDPEVAKVVPSMERGGVAGPIRGISGYYIIGLADKRQLQLGQTLYEMRAVALPLEPGAGDDAVQARIEEAAGLRGELQGCGELTQRVADEVSDAEVRDFGKLPPGDLPPDMARAVQNLQEGQFSEPFRRADSVMLAMICNKDASGLDRQRITENLQREQLELISRRYMRDLRRSANVDIRQ